MNSNDTSPAKAQLDERQSSEPEGLAAEESKFVAQWLAQQPNQWLRQQFTDGRLSPVNATNLMAAAILDDLLGPAYEGHICDVCSRDRLLNDPRSICDEWETPHLPPDLHPAWQEMKTKLPEGTQCSFYEVFPCVVKRLEKPDDEAEGASKLTYVAKVSVPVGPFRFERTVLLKEPEATS